MSDQDVVELLAQKAYHLPGNTYWEDWRQYFGNNHPLFSICFQNKLHPISRWMRVVALVGSFAFGLLITNIIWLLFIYNTNDEETQVFELSAGGYAVKDGDSFTILDEDSDISRYTSLEVTNGNIILWTVGGLLHAIFDSSIWYAATCACCGDGRYESIVKYKIYGIVAVLFLVTVFTALSLGFVIARASLESQSNPTDIEDLQGGGLIDAATDVQKVTDKNNVEFVISYCVELVFTWFIWFPAVETLVFSGFCGLCWKYPFVGGRPYEMHQLDVVPVEEEAEEEQPKKKKKKKKKEKAEEEEQPRRHDNKKKKKKKKQKQKDDTTYDQDGIKVSPA